MKKVLLILFLLALVSFVALWGYVESDAFGDRLRPYIVRPLKEILGPGSQVGKVKATLLPLVIEVRDIVVPSTRSPRSLAIRKVRVYINPVPLLWKRISLSSVTLLEPSIEAKRGPDGSLDLSAVVGSIRSALERRQKEAGPGMSVRLRSVTIRNGSATITDDASSVQMAISGLDSKAIFRPAAAEGIIRISSGTVSIMAPSYPALAGELRATVSYAGAQISVSSVELRSKAARIAVSGTFAAAVDGTLDLKVRSRLGAGLFGAVTGILDRRHPPPMIDAAASLTGTVSDPRLEGSATMTAIPLRGVLLSSARLALAYQRKSLSVTGRDWVFARGERTFAIKEVAAQAAYEGGVLRIARAEMMADDDEIRASGTIDAEKGFGLALSARSLGKGKMLRFLTDLDISGSMALSGRLFGALSTPSFEGTATAGPFTIRNIAFQSLTGLVRFRDRTVSIVGATIRQDASRYLLDGSVSFAGDDPFYQARLGIIRSDVVSVVALFYQPLPLDITASGELAFAGTRKTFSGSGHLDLAPGAAYGESFENGSLNVELTSSRIIFRRLMLDKGGGHIAGRGWIGFNGTYYAALEGSGIDLTSVDHMRTLSLAGPCDLTIRSSGSFSEPMVTAHAEAAELSRLGLPLGAAVVDLSLKNKRLDLSSSLTHKRNGSIDLIGSMGLARPYPWTATAAFRLSEISLATMLPESRLFEKISFSTEGRITLQGAGGSSSSLEGSAVLPNVRVVMADYLVENEGDAVIRFERGALRVQHAVLAGTGTRFAVSGGLRPGKDIDLLLTGDMNVSLIRLLYEEVEHGDGTATVRLAVSDTWQNPTVDGRVTVRNGMLKVLDIPQKFTDMNGTILFDRDRVLTEGISAQAGGGRVTLIGSAQLRDAALLDFSARAVIEDVTVRYPPGLTATLAGTLYYDGDLTKQSLAGELTIERAKYEKRIEWKSMLVDISRGITRKTKTDVGWIGETQLNIRFLGTDNILFESNLAKIPIKIDVLFRGTVNQLQLLGRIEAREGEVYFRNNVFRILYASADFVDPSRLNPVLDVQAETRVRDYRIRLAVAGNADRAVVTFLSDPPLTDSDILALLALGRRGEELKGKEADVGMSEAASFLSGKFQDLFESRARSLTGLDRFQVDPYINKTDSAVPRVTVGKEVVEDRLFMTYSSNIGGTTPEKNLRIEYILNRNISVLGEYDELGQIGADLKFRFEFR